MDPNKKPTILDVYYRVVRRASVLKGEAMEPTPEMTPEDIAVARRSSQELYKVAADMELLDEVNPPKPSTVSAGDAPDAPSTEAQVS